MLKKYFLMLLIMTYSLLLGCGQPGALYLPDKNNVNTSLMNNPLNP